MTGIGRTTGRKRRRFAILLIGLLLALAAAGCGEKLQSEDKTVKQEYPVLTSENDEDGDGIDDFTDILEGARSYIATKPVYKSEYYQGGYPDKGYGVCTDVIWSAFQAAGYDLKAMVDEDIAENPEEYGIDQPDPNIDFRRVKNLQVFFERNAESLSTDFDDPSQWQPGDIVVFTKHIGICSDKRNKDGVPYLIHHPGLARGAVEADDMADYTVTGHYRWE